MNYVWDPNPLPGVDTQTEQQFDFQPWLGKEWAPTFGNPMTYNDSAPPAAVNPPEPVKRRPVPPTPVGEPEGFKHPAPPAPLACDEDPPTRANSPGPEGSAEDDRVLRIAEERLSEYKIVKLGWKNEDETVPMVDCHPEGHAKLVFGQVPFDFTPSLMKEFLLREFNVSVAAARPQLCRGMYRKGTQRKTGLWFITVPGVDVDRILQFDRRLWFITVDTYVRFPSIEEARARVDQNALVLHPRMSPFAKLKPVTIEPAKTPEPNWVHKAARAKEMGDHAYLEQLRYSY